jgi:peptide/nickel transport system substrate-binding protein
VYGLSWVGIKTPDIFDYVFASHSFPPAGANRGRYENQQVDDWLAQAKASQDLAKKATFYRKVAAQVQADSVYAPLWYEDQLVIRQKNLRGYVIAPDGGYGGLNWLEKQP